MAELRLIESPQARAQLLAAVSAVPAGVKLSIPQLRDALVSQLDVLNALGSLVKCGELDRATLRPPAKPPVAVTKVAPPAKLRPTGAELHRRIIAEIERRGLSRKGASIAIFGRKARLNALGKSGARAVHAGTFKTIEAWLAESAKLPAADEAARAEPEGRTRTPAPAPRNRAAALTRSSRGAATQANRAALASAPAKSPGDDGSAARPPDEREPSSESAPPPAPHPVLAEIEAFIARHGVSPSRFGRLAANGEIALVRQLRNGRQPREKMVERIRAFIADPPAELFAAKRSAEPPRDLTQRPATPGLDLADRQRLNGHRHSASIRRGQEREAREKLERGEKPANSFEKTLMGHIEQRRAEEARQQDPVEIAKLALRRRGRVVYSCSVTGGRADRFTVSGCRDETTGKNRQFDEAALIALARQVNPTAMEGVGA